MKKIATAVLAAVLALTMGIPAFAGQWQQDSNGRRYIEEDGSYPVNTWKWINEMCYYFGGNGYMLHDTTAPDGSTVGGHGAWVINDVVQLENQTDSGIAGTYWNSEAWYGTFTYEERSITDDIVLIPQADGNLKVIWLYGEGGEQTYIFASAGDQKTYTADHAAWPGLSKITISDANSFVYSINNEDGSWSDMIYQKL